MTAVEAEKASFPEQKDAFADEKNVELHEEEAENSPIEPVRIAVPITDDTSLVSVTFRFWVISTFLGAIGAIIKQYYAYRSATGTFSIFFVNLASYSMGKFLARVLPTRSISIFGHSFSLNPGPFNIKEHALIGIAVSTAADSAYATEILSATDLFLNDRVPAIGALLLIISTQCVGYGMAGSLRKYLVYPAQMVWWSNLVQVIFYNAIHNTDEFKNKRMVYGWSYMKYFWVVCGIIFVYQLLPQWLAPVLLYFDWVCWINPFNKDFWAIFSAISGGGVLSLSFDWSTIGGSSLYYPLAPQLNSYLGMILNYWIILPIMWLNNILGTKTIGRPLSSKLFYDNGTRFDITTVLNDDHTLNEELYETGPPANMSPLYALGFMTSFIALAGCISHIAFFHGREILDQWKQASDKDIKQDIHTKMMKVYPEVPQLWYAGFYVIMAALSILTCEVYHLQLPWWGLLVSLALGWLLTLPIGTMIAITGYGPGLNVITELVCGYMLPGKPIANMAFKCYGYMAMSQATSLLSDLKLGHYMKIPPRSMFISQFWGTLIGSIFNYATMTLIIDSNRSYLDGTVDDPAGLWTGQGIQIFWGSGLIYGALGPARMFALDGKYGFVYLGFLIGFLVPAIQWGLSKKFPKISWSKFNISIFASGMGAFPAGYSMGILSSLITVLVFRFYLAKYHANWWKKYAYITSAALDTGTAFTGLLIFFFLGGGISPKLNVVVPSWWFNHQSKNPDAPNYPYYQADRCGAADPDMWTGL
ncbi:hypothetical protein BGZ52_008779 [Haplosporangium bisporale]|nr:hypothetical protein BGZ52_008779 [Haplosporangium bisporale]KFH67477.1 OPT family small oligopeptide transporter [Podila verticillata NRRL 6337]